MIEFKTLKARDIFSYERLEFCFATGIHAIHGANGTAKSSIYHALCFALFNRTPKGGRVDAVNNCVTGRAAEVEVVFVKDGRSHYRVVNSRAEGSIRVFLDHGADNIAPKRIPAALKFIEELLGVGYDTFVGLTYHCSKSSLALVEEAGDAARKEFIGDLLRFDELDHLLKRFKERSKDCGRDTEALQARITQAEASYRQPKEVPVAEEGLPQVEAQLEVAEASLEQLHTDVAKAEQARDEAARRFNEASSQAKAHSVIAELQQQVEAYQGPTDLEELNDRIEKGHGQQAKVCAEIQALNDQASRLVKPQAPQFPKAPVEPREPETVCSRCRRALDNKEALAVYHRDLEEYRKKRGQHEQTVAELDAMHRADLDGYQRQKDELAQQTRGKNDLLARVRERLDALKKERADLHQHQKRCARIEELRSQAGDPGDTDALHEQWQRQEEEHNTLIDQRQSARAEVSALRSRVTMLQNQQTEARLAREYNDEVAEYNRQLDDQIAQLREELGTLHREHDRLKLWVDILGSKGYRLRQMNAFLLRLNEAMGVYADMLSGGAISCRFYLDEDGKVCFDVTDADKSVPFELWSDGEKARVKLTCLLAVFEMLEHLSGTSFNLLFLDEIFASLDEAGREGLFVALAALRSRGKAVYTIAHQPVANAVVFDSSTWVMKTGGISCLLDHAP